nr:thioredoxin family protein [Mobilitalea sibirica]
MNESTTEENVQIQNTEELVIKILGSGCKNCVTLADNVHKALEEMKLNATVVKVTDLAEISGYGVMTTPALVVNEKVVSYGKVLKPNEVMKLMEKLV